MHTNIHANEFVPSDIKFTSAATNDSFMLKPANYNDGDIIAMDRAYIDYARFEELTNRGVTYVTKMKKNLVYDTLADTMYMLPCGLMECRVQVVEFRKHIKGRENIKHKARIVTYVDPAKKKAKVISLLTNDMTMEVEDIIDISPSDGHKKAHQTLLELFWIGINGKNHAHVLCELLYFS